MLGPRSRPPAPAQATSRLERQERAGLSEGRGVGTRGGAPAPSPALLQGPVAPAAKRAQNALAWPVQPPLVPKPPKPTHWGTTEEPELEVGGLSPPQFRPRPRPRLEAGQATRQAPAPCRPSAWAGRHGGQPSGMGGFLAEPQPSRHSDCKGPGPQARPTRAVAGPPSPKSFAAGGSAPPHGRRAGARRVGLLPVPATPPLHPPLAAPEAAQHTCARPPAHSGRLSATPAAPPCPRPPGWERHEGPAQHPAARPAACPLCRPRWGSRRDVPEGTQLAGWRQDPRPVGQQPSQAGSWPGPGPAGQPPLRAGPPGGEGQGAPPSSCW